MDISGLSQIFIRIYKEFRFFTNIDAQTTFDLDT